MCRNKWKHSLTFCLFQQSRNHWSRNTSSLYYWPIQPIRISWVNVNTFVSQWQMRHLYIIWPRFIDNKCMTEAGKHYVPSPFSGIYKSEHISKGESTLFRKAISSFSIRIQDNLPSTDCGFLSSKYSVSKLIVWSWWNDLSRNPDWPKWQMESVQRAQSWPWKLLKY